jgi:hypothetical protein
MFKGLPGIIFCFIFSLLIIPPVTAQEGEEQEEDLSGEEYYEEEYYEDEREKKLKIMDFMLDIGVPQRAFSDRLNKTGVGFNFTMLFQLRLNKPGFLGFDLYGYHMDRERDIIIDFINGNSVELERNFNNWIVGGDLVYRYFPPLNIPVIEPYFEGLIGYKWIFSTYETKDIIDDASLDFQFYKSSWSLSYGISLGAQIFLSDRYYLNIRATYLPGNSVSYYSRNPDADGSNTSSPTDYFDLKNSATDLFRYQFGFSILLP